VIENLRSVPRFQVIDCETLDIVPEKFECKYLALIYVWGSPIANPDEKQVDRNDSPMPSDLLILVKDAITVTKGSIALSISLGTSASSTPMSVEHR
jgi:hypothetical protein